MKIVKWLDYKEVGPGKRPEQSIKEGLGWLSRSLLKLESSLTKLF